MPTEIKPKYSTAASLTVTLASLASSTGGISARQSTLVDNSTARYSRIHLYPKVKLGTTPTANRAVFLWALRGDGTNRVDEAGASDAAITVENATPLGALANGASITGDVLIGHFIIEAPGPEWGVAVGHETGVNLDSTGSNHAIRWVGETSELQ